MKLQILKFLMAIVMATSIHTLHAQTVDGYVVKATGDTLRGTFSTAQVEQFKCILTGNGGETTFTPQEVSTFGLTNGRKFVSQPLQTSNGLELVFAELSASGKHSLLRYYQDFYLDDGTETFRLEMIISDIVKDGRKYQRVNNKFQQTLAWKFADCPDIVVRLKDVTLDERSLKKVFNSYYKCIGASTASAAPSNSRIYIGVEGGYGALSLSEIAQPTRSYLNNNFTKNGYTVAGLFFQFKPRSTGWVSVGIGLQKSQLEFETTRQYVEVVNFDDHIKVSYDDYKIPFYVNFELMRNKKFRPVARVGFAYHVTANSSTERQRKAYTQPPITLTDPAFDVKKSAECVFIDAGIEYEARRMVISLRSRLDRGYSPLQVAEEQEGGRIAQTDLSAILSFAYVLTRE